MGEDVKIEKIECVPGRYRAYRWLSSPDGAIAMPVDWQIRENALSQAHLAVARSMSYALRKHGRPTRDPVRGVINLSEELGEVAREALDATRNYSHSDVDRFEQQEKFNAIARMYGELGQLAGYAILLMMSMEGILPDQMVTPSVHQREIIADVEDGNRSDR